MTPKSTILVVDDAEDVRNLLEAVLGKQYAVKTAADADAGLRVAFEPPRPDLILLDVEMPGASGYDFCKTLKATPALADVPVIFLTGRAETEDVLRGFGIGAIDYIAKPVVPTVLAARVGAQLELIAHRHRQEELLRERTTQLEQTRQQLIRRLGRAMEFHESSAVGNRVVRLGHYARALAQAAGAREMACELLMKAAPLHDIGKLGVAAEVLRKQGKLTAPEMEQMRRHPEIGADIIGEHDDPLLKLARTLALTHHERWDGSGYPAGMGGNDIPWAGRVMAIVDAFESMTATQFHRAPLPIERAEGEILRGAGTHFDPAMVEAFRKALPEFRRIHQTYGDQLGDLLDLDFASADRTLIPATAKPAAREERPPTEEELRARALAEAKARLEAEHAAAGELGVRPAPARAPASPPEEEPQESSAEAREALARAQELLAQAQQEREAAEKALAETDARKRTLETALRAEGVLYEAARKRKEEEQAAARAAQERLAAEQALAATRQSPPAAPPPAPAEPDPRLQNALEMLEEARAGRRLAEERLQAEKKAVEEMRAQAQDERRAAELALLKAKEESDAAARAVTENRQQLERAEAILAQAEQHKQALEAAAHAAAEGLEAERGRYEAERGRYEAERGRYEAELAQAREQSAENSGRLRTLEEELASARKELEAARHAGEEKRTLTPIGEDADSATRRTAEAMERAEALAREAQAEKAAAEALTREAHAEKAAAEALARAAQDRHAAATEMAENAMRPPKSSRGPVLVAFLVGAFVAGAALYLALPVSTPPAAPIVVAPPAPVVRAPVAPLFDGPPLVLRLEPALATAASR